MTMLPKITRQQLQDLVALIADNSKEILQDADMLVSSLTTQHTPDVVHSAADSMVPPPDEILIKIHKKVDTLDMKLLEAGYGDDVILFVKSVVCNTILANLERSGDVPEEVKDCLPVAFGVDIPRNVPPGEFEMALWRERVAAMIPNTTGNRKL